MRPNRLKQLWREDRPAIGGWLNIGDAFVAEIMARQGFDWVCIDTQHGLIDYSAAVHMLQAISQTDAVPVIRVPWNEPGVIMKALDAGAYAVIIPMVNTPDQAAAAVAACRYAPVGIRSMGPVRASAYGGADYGAHANDEVACVVMIETQEALRNVESIVSVPGVDAVYIGPSDMSLSLGLGIMADNEQPEFAAARKTIVEACRRHGVVAGIHTNTQYARARIEEGFRLVLVTSDVNVLGRGLRADLAAVRDQQPQPDQRTIA